MRSSLNIYSHLASHLAIKMPVLSRARIPKPWSDGSFIIRFPLTMNFRNFGNQHVDFLATFQLSSDI